MTTRYVGLFLLSPLLLLAGCGSAPAPSFALVVTPNVVTVQNGGAAQSLAVGVNPVNGFAGSVNVQLTGLPAGVSASPTTMTLSPGQLGQFSLAAKNAVVGQTASLSITGSAAAGGGGTLTGSGTASLQVTQAISNVSLSATSFDFGEDLVGGSVTQQVVSISNTGGTVVTLAPALAGDSSFTLAASSTCGPQLAAGAQCLEAVTYAPQTASGSTPQTATLNLGLGNVPSGTAGAVMLTGVSAALPAPVLSSTQNPLVAQYSVVMPFPGTVTVQFGTDTTYGRQTAPVTTTTAGEAATVLVAGMPQNTTYHLQGIVQLASGAQVNDVDRTFANGTSEVNPQISAYTQPGATPQPGVEQVTLVSGGVGLLVTDLQGRPIWSYQPPNAAIGYDIEGAKLLPNGHYLISLGQGSSFPLENVPAPTEAIDAIREIDLAGNIVREISIGDLNDELTAHGYSVTLEQFHHDVLPLPNGHWIVLSNTLKTFQDLPGYPGATEVLGDVLVDLDEDMQPVWVWNAFDHLDVNRHPMGFPDWTHGNAVVYSPTDHNLFFSMRHQNWVLKLDYNDGADSGNILWRLGEGGDFTLQGGTDPTDWAYAQHYPSLFTANSAGVFSMGLMDNGDDREFPPTVQCGTPGAPACQYTTVPVFQIDETQKTATVMYRETLDPSLYSFFGGSVDQLANGDVEYDLCAETDGSKIFENKPGSSGPQPVWQMSVGGANAYRSIRIPSLYPGVQW